MGGSPGINAMAVPHEEGLQGWAKLPGSNVFQAREMAIKRVVQGDASRNVAWRICLDH